MFHVPRMVTTALVVALAAGAPGLAQASPQPAHAQRPAGPVPPAPPGSPDGRLPAGWQLTGTGDGRHLVWRSTGPVPMGDARVEFYAGDRLLGRPVADRDGRTFRLRLDGAQAGSLTELRAMAGGRRLDEAGAARNPDTLRPAGPARLPAPLPANQVDPGVPGDYRTVSGEYDLKSVRLPGFPTPVEMRATVVAPDGAPGRRPLALFLHGRHYTCFGGPDQESADWPCKPGTRPVPSYRGYLHDQKLLASQGYVTVSISANGINAQDGDVEDGGAQARSSLVRLHLARWADWSSGRARAPESVRGAARAADLSRVLLVGHSRGGEGVNRAAMDSLTRPPADQDGYRGPARWRIRGTVLIGPTLFGQNPVPDVPSMTILPGCDGDVSDLQGQIFVDGTRGVSRGSALHSAVYMIGANHNYFNSEWTPGQAEAPASDDFWADDTPDPVCSPGRKSRLTATQQQTAGSTYIAAAARLFVAGDDRVRPLLDGSGRRAPSADPARVLTHAVGARRTPAFLPDAEATVSGGRLCSQSDPATAKHCLTGARDGVSPHFAEWLSAGEPGPSAVAMRWSQPGTPARMTPARPFSVRGAQSLALRVMVPPNTTGTELDVALTDTSGRRAKLGRVRVDGLPGSDRTASAWAREVRVPLAAATRAGFDAGKVKTLELTPRSRSGKAWLMDAWGWRPGTPAVRPAALPRVDIGRLVVKEGNSGTRTYQVPVRVTGHGRGQIRLFVPKPGTEEFTSRTVTVGKGSPAVELPVTVRGNTRYGYDVPYTVYAKAVRGVVVGSYAGGVTARNDDPMPEVTVKPVANKVAEGEKLSWKVSLSAPADAYIEAGLSVLPVSGGTELSTKDVGRQWLDETFGVSPDPARPLSRATEDPYVFVPVPEGRTSVTVTVPTVKDGVREPEETLRLRLVTYDADWDPQQGPEFTGTVRDAT